MPKESLATITKRRLLGVLFIVIVVAFVSLSIAIYKKAFTDTVDVTLKASTTGNQLILDSDVKERGIIVGSVTRLASDGTDAIVTLSLDPSKTRDIPRNVSAQILPKTLFGEQYVSLIYPTAPQRPIKQGDVISQGKGALEAQDVFGDLLPLLTAVQPAELQDTLNAIVVALRGRGEKLGETLTNLDKYLKIMNPHTQQLVDDLDKLGKVATEYNDVAPDIFATLDNLQTSVRTVIDRRSALDNLLVTGSGSAGVLQSFLSDNRQRLITVTGQSQKVFGLLAEYSPEFSCLFKGMDHLADLANDAIYANMIHLSATINGSNPGAYKVGQQPRLVTGYGPSCFGLPNAPKPFPIPPKYRCLNDGAPLTNDPCGGAGTAATSAAATRSVGSPQENALVNAIIAGPMHTTPNKVSGGATLLTAPLLRGSSVNVK